MKQLIQNMKVLRAMSGRFLSTAVVMAAVLTFTNPAQADPGQGAIFLSRDGPQSLTTSSPDGLLKLEIVYDGTMGDFVRANPDGTLSINTTGTQAAMTVSVLDEGEYIPAWIGSGSFHSTDLVEPSPDPDFHYMSTGEARYWHIQGQLISLLDGSEWSLHVVVVQQDQEFKVLTLDFQPMGG